MLRRPADEPRASAPSAIPTGPDAPDESIDINMYDRGDALDDAALCDVDLDGGLEMDLDAGLDLNLDTSQTPVPIDDCQGQAFELCEPDRYGFSLVACCNLERKLCRRKTDVPGFNSNDGSETHNRN